MVFTLFAVCILMVLLTGADVYTRLVEDGEEAYARRTAAQYLTTRVRQGECVSTEDFGGCDALVFRETIGSRAYLTRVYCYDGAIRELFSAEGGDFSPEEGETVLEASKLSFSLDGALLQAEIAFPDGSTEQLTWYLRTGQEVAP